MGTGTAVSMRKINITAINKSKLKLIKITCMLIVSGLVMVGRRIKVVVYVYAFTPFR